VSTEQRLDGGIRLPAGTVAVVTGGGRGIGAAFVEGLARAGAACFIADVIDEGQLLADRLTGEGLDVTFRRTDVTDRSSLDALVAACRDRHGRLDVLVNNASIYQDLGSKRPFHEIEPADWDRVMAVNVKGTWLASAAARELLEASPAGRIISVASSTVHMGVPYFAHYVASKAAVMGLTRSLAKELGHAGVTVNAIAPGLVDTEATRTVNDPGYLATAAERRAIPRIQVPGDLVGAALFLASPASSFITGQTIVVDGGATFV
jgi:NAD(P)-dependent dehydrogenase (short-subunit alcohol dehydrogenase family)